MSCLFNPYKKQIVKMTIGHFKWEPAERFLGQETVLRASLSKKGNNHISQSVFLYS